MEKEKENIDYGRVIHSWSFRQDNSEKRSRSWYVSVVLIFGILSVAAIVQGNYLFFFLIILFLLIVFVSQMNNTTTNFKITDGGIVIGKKFYKHKDIDHFWLVYYPPDVKMLYFEMNNFFNSQIGISIENENPVEIRKTLLNFVNEDLDKEDQPFSDHISRWLKF